MKSASYPKRRNGIWPFSELLLKRMANDRFFNVKVTKYSKKALGVSAPRRLDVALKT